MRWASPGAAAVIVASVAVAGSAFAQPKTDHRRDVTSAIEARLAAVTKTDKLLADKYATRSAELRSRVRSLYKLSRAGWSPLWVAPEQRGATLRLRAAARRIVRRDVHELGLLRDEIAAAASARARLENDRDATSSVRWPEPSTLERPVRGRVVSAFGSYRHRASGARLTRRGVELRSRAGRRVNAVADGQVRYAGPVRGLGTAIVIGHDGYLSVVGHLASTVVRTGDRVRVGDQVGDASGRRVYLEIRLAIGAGGFPIDPAPLLR